MFRFTRLSACLAAGLAVLCAGCTGSSPPDDPTGPPTSQSTTATATPTPSPTSTADPADDEQALLDKAKTDGQVKVLVRLKLPPGTAKAAREQAIADAQDQLQAELQPLGVKVEQRFKHSPLVALSANEATLRQLFESDLVDGVEENSVSRTQS